MKATTHKIYIGDAKTILKKLPEKIIEFSPACYAQKPLKAIRED